MPQGVKRQQHFPSHSAIEQSAKYKTIQLPDPRKHNNIPNVAGDNKYNKLQ